MARQEKRNLGPETRTGSATKRGMFKKEAAIENAGFKSQVPTVSQNKTQPAVRTARNVRALGSMAAEGRAAAEEGRSNSARGHAAIGPVMTDQQKETFAGGGGNVDPSPLSQAAVIGNSRGLKRAGIDATRTESYTRKGRLRRKR